MHSGRVVSSVVGSRNPRYCAYVLRTCCERVANVCGRLPQSSLLCACLFCTCMYACMQVWRLFLRMRGVCCILYVLYHIPLNPAFYAYVCVCCSAEVKHD